MPGPDPKSRKHGREPSKKVAAGVTVLPPFRKGRAPEPKTELPISDEGRQFWADLWTSPQSTRWSSQDSRRTTPYVYMATRLLLAFEKQRDDGFSVPVSTEMRQLEHSLGLTDKAMKELGWVVGDLSEQEPSRPSGKRYDHLKVVDTSA